MVKILQGKLTIKWYVQFLKTRCPSQIWKFNQFYADQWPKRETEINENKSEDLLN